MAAIWVGLTVLNKMRKEAPSFSIFQLFHAWPFKEATEITIGHVRTGCER